MLELSIAGASFFFRMLPSTYSKFASIQLAACDLLQAAVRSPRVGSPASPMVVHGWRSLCLPIRFTYLPEHNRNSGIKPKPAEEDFNPSSRCTSH